MNKEWVAQQEAEHAKTMAKMRVAIVSKIESSDLFTPEEKEKMLRHLKEMEEEAYSINKINYDLMLASFGEGDDIFDKVMAFKKDLNVDKYHGMIQRRGGYSRYLDSEPKEFDGDIIITDPCYVRKHRDESSRPKWEGFMKSSYGKTEEERRAAGFYEDYKKLEAADAEWEERNPDDWAICECGYNMEALGINTYMTRDTIYGDWGCTTYDSDTKEELGHFCADAGLVSVFLLDEVLRYNPEFNYHEERTWTTTWIPNFKGTVQFVVVREEGFYKEDSEWWKTGDKWVEYEVRVVGHGINKVTGEPINFITSQSSL